MWQLQRKHTLPARRCEGDRFGPKSHQETQNHAEDTKAKHTTTHENDTTTSARQSEGGHFGLISQINNDVTHPRRAATTPLGGGNATHDDKATRLAGGHSHLQRPPATTSISTELRGNDQHQQHHDARQDRAAGGDVPVSSATKRQQTMGTHHFHTVTKDDDQPNTQKTDSNNEQSQLTMTKSQNHKQPNKIRSQSR